MLLALAELGMKRTPSSSHISLRFSPCNFFNSFYNVIFKHYFLFKSEPCRYLNN